MLKCKKRELIVNFIFMLVLFLNCAFFKYKAASIVSLAVFVIYMFYLLKMHSKIYIKYFYQFFCTAAVLVPLTMIEFGHVYVSETVSYSQFVGSIPLQALAYYILFSTISYFDTFFEKKYKLFTINSTYITRFKNINGKTTRYLNITTWIAIFSFIYIFLCVMKDPSFLLGVSRGIYATTHNFSKLYYYIIGFASMLLIPCILSILYGRRILGIVGVTIYFLYCFWVGNKFGTFMETLCIFLLIFYPKISDNSERIRKLIFVGIIILSILIGVAAFAFSFTSTTDIGTFLATRISGQAALWWRTFDVSGGNIHLSQISNEVQGVLFGSNSIDENAYSNYGIYNIMYLCGPKNIVKADILRGSRYTEAGYASAYYIFGLIGPIMLSLFGAFIYSWLTNCFLSYLNNNQIIIAGIILRFLLLFNGFMSMFTLNQYRSILNSMLLFVFILLKNKKIKFAKR